MATHNYGIINTGSGTITAKQMAVGDNAIAIGGDNADIIRKKLDELLQAVQVSGNKLKNQEQVLDATKAVVDEFLKEKPNKITLKALLNEIASEAQSVEPITSAVKSLKVEFTNFL